MREVKGLKHGRHSCTAQDGNHRTHCTVCWITGHASGVKGEVKKVPTPSPSHFPGFA